MPIYEIELPDGEVIELDSEGAEMSTADLQAFARRFKDKQAAAAAPTGEEDIARAERFRAMAPGLKAGAEESRARAEEGVLKSAAKVAGGIGEVAGTMVSGAVAEPISGLAGIAGGLLPGDEGQAARAVKGVQEAMTYMPRTEAGQQVGASIGKAIQPVAEPLARGLTAAADVAAEEAGPAAGAAVMTVPTLLMELVGLKGLRAAKKLQLKKALKSSDTTQLYDELGRVLPEVEEGIRRSGLSVEDVQDVLPKVKEELATTATKETAEAAAGELGGAASKVFRPSKAIGEIAEGVQPDVDILQAAERMGIDDMLLGSHVAKNQTFTAVEQGLKSVPGSPLAVKEANLVKQLATEADSIIEEFGGVTDKSLLSDNFRTKVNKSIKDLEKAAETQFGDIKKRIKPSTPVEANNVMEMLQQRIDELNGEKYLEPSEKLLLRDLAPESKPTYARLDNIRKQIGSAYKKNTGMFKDSSTEALDRMYGALAQDQKAVAGSFGLEEAYKAANTTIITRKGIEDKLVNLLGKDLLGTISAKSKQAIMGLEKGDTKAWDTLIKNIPEEVGPDMRKNIIVSSLNDALTSGSKMEKQFHVQGFDNFMQGLKRNKVAANRLKKEVGAEGWKRLEDLATVTHGVRKAQKHGITTGRITGVPGMIDQSKSIAGRLFGTAGKMAAAGAGAVAAGPAGGLAMAGASSLLGNVLRRTPRSIKAAEMLSSSQFNRLIASKAAGRLDTAAKVQRAEEILDNLKAFKEWKETLPPAELKEVAAAGALAYLAGETSRQEEE